MLLFRTQASQASGGEQQQQSAPSASAPAPSGSGSNPQMLPDLDVFNLAPNSSASGAKKKDASADAASADAEMQQEENTEDNLPLFYRYISISDEDDTLAKLFAHPHFTVFCDISRPLYLSRVLVPTVPRLSRRQNFPLFLFLFEATWRELPLSSFPLPLSHCRYQMSVPSWHQKKGGGTNFFFAQPSSVFLLLIPRKRLHASA